MLSCNNKKEKKDNKINENIAVSNYKYDFTTHLKYAKGFTISYNKLGYKEIRVLDPWNKGKIFQKYYLVNHGLKVETPSDGIKIRVPVKNIAALSNTQIGILKFLNEEDKIIAVSVANNVYDSVLSKKISQGKIIGLGHGPSLNFEKIINLSPELTMVAAFMRKTPTQIKIEHAKLAIAYNIEWMEKSPLARAEWCKYIACFFNKEKLASKLFDQLEENYHLAQKIANKVLIKPNIIAGAQFKGIWYTPSGNSYLAQILKDAGADYAWYSKKGQGSIPLNFESVYDTQENADIWINPGEFKSLTKMLDSDKRYGLFKAFVDKNVFAKTKRINKSGANDYWESSVMKPDMVLKDFIKIIHPKKLPNYNLYYYTKLK